MSALHPSTLIRAAHNARLAVRRPLSRLRATPRFVIIGAQKAGTTTLYDMICQHSLVRPAIRKEVHYFDHHYDKGEWWYRAFFPVRGTGAQWITGEASPLYLFHPDVPARMRYVLPEVRAIAVLRNPVDRAISHYNHARRKGYEVRAIDEALSPGLPRTSTATRSWFQSATYLERGYYAEQLTRWFRVYPRCQINVLRSEDLFGAPGAVMERVLAFLGLPASDIAVRESNVHPHAVDPTDRLRERLEEHYEPYNKQLADLLGVEGWW